MTLIGYRSSNHPQQVARRGAQGQIDDRETHPDDFAIWQELPCVLLKLANGGGS